MTSTETSTLRFYLNGHLVEMDGPPPDLLLLDFLRSPEVALTGAKKGCGQGGCGACTVILSDYDASADRVEHRSINSCLRPVCSLQGMAVTTIEGTGAVVPVTDTGASALPSASRSGFTLGRRLPRDEDQRRKMLDRLLSQLRTLRVDNAPKLLVRRLAPAQLRPTQLRDPLVQLRPVSLRSSERAEADSASDPFAPPTGINPVAHRLAVNNGSQCGYCSVGFVMAMSALLLENEAPTKAEIEASLDGNLCRCTGYRPILTAMKTFASDWSEEDEARRMKCVVDPAYDSSKVATLRACVPPGVRAEDPALAIDWPGRQWRSCDSIPALTELVQANPGVDLRLVHGNTSYGVYPEEFRAATVLVDIRAIPELRQVLVEDGRLVVGAGTTYTQLLALLASLGANEEAAATTRLGALDLMARRTAGTIVRNAASLGGNTAIALEHVHAGEPFPSDLLTALVACEAGIVRVDLDSGEVHEGALAELIDAVVARDVDPRRQLLLGYVIPRGRADEIVLAQKVALREVNAHSIVNATTRLGFEGETTVVEAASLIFAGLGPVPFHASKTAALLVGRPLSLDHFPALAACLDAEILANFERWAERMAEVPNEGFTPAYRRSLAQSFLYKAIVNALDQRAPAELPNELRSAGVITFGRWPVTEGVQSYKTQGYKAPVQEPYIGLMTLYQTSGEIHYTHELQVPPTALNGALVLVEQAPRKFYFQLPEAPGQRVTRAELRAHLRATFDDFAELITATEIPKGGRNNSGMASDQPLFAESEVLYPGQCVAMVLCPTEQRADHIASYISARCIGYEPLGWPAPFDASILSLTEAIELGSVFPDCPSTASYVAHVWRVRRPGSDLSWICEARGDTDRSIEVHERSVDGLRCQVVSTSQEVGGQIHFYMETQACVATPADANLMIVHPSSQSPMEMHQTAAAVLGVPQNRIRVQLRQLGGAFGGKTEQARFVTGPTVVAADVTNRPVRLVLERGKDSAMLGHRHPYFGQCQVAVDLGVGRPESRGMIRGIDVKMWGDGGAYYDCSFIVSNNILMRADNAYNVPNSRMQIDVCRTNKAPNTAFRAFGDVQSKVITESAIDDAAFAIGMAPEELRRKNLYVRGDVTPFGQALSYCYMREVWDHLEEVSDFESKRAAVEDYNRANKWRKRGIAMVPVKYGSGYNLVMLEQASAVVSVYSADGTVVINQAGSDMGQGALTQVVQVAAYILNIPMSMIRIELPDTGVLPNPTSTGASTGTAYNAEATKGACRLLRQRLLDFGYQMLQKKGNDWCRDAGIDFWNYGDEGWAHPVVVGGNAPKPIWQYLVGLAYQYRVNLVAQFLAPMRGGETPAPAIEFKPVADQPQIPGIQMADVDSVYSETDNFVGFTYSAACCVVEVDILTGESKILDCDLMYDMGWSINPALDIGQVEGAFMQGVGYLLSEWLVYEPEGDNQGRLNTDNTWTYKPPAVPSVPLRFNTHLFPRDLADHVPENPAEVMSAKEVGEPPLVLATAVFLALKRAVRASRLERGLDGLFVLDAPATVQAVQRACELNLSK